MASSKNRDYANRLALTADRSDFLRQVGKTLGGSPVDDGQIAQFVDAVGVALELRESDVLLDLCCGNGVLTDRLFDRCRGGVGVDFSENLVAIAKEFFESAPDRTYVVGDVEAFLAGTVDCDRFTKACCHAALQYLTRECAIRALTLLRARFPNVETLFVGELPDKDRMEGFYYPGVYVEGLENDPESPMGIWRTEDEFRELARAAGWEAEIRRMPAEYHTSSYRYNAVLTRPLGTNRGLRFESIACPSHPSSPAALARAVLERFQSLDLLVLRSDGEVRPFSFWREVAVALGSGSETEEDGPTGVRESGMPWADIRYDPALSDTFRHHNSAQPLHTDGAFYGNHPDFVMMYCERSAPSGGETIFVGAHELQEALAADEPQLLADLASMSVAFSKFDHLGREATVIGRDHQGARLNWNYYRVSPDVSREVKALCEAFHSYLQERFVDRGEYRSVAMEPGDVVIFRDTRMLHGRTAFDVREGENRLLWKRSLRLYGEA